MDTLDICRTQLNNVFNAIFLVYIPAIEVAMHESTNIIEKTEAMNSLLATFTNLGHEFCLAATCAQVHLPRARAEQILYPHFIASYFAGRDFYSELERCEHLLWNLTGESTQSFQQIVHDVTPYMLMYTRRRSFRVRDNPFKLDLRNRILLVIIWLRMYPEVAVLSGLFMICPSSVEREVRFLLPVLWNYFKEFLRWPTSEEWLEMANNWEMFPGAVAVIDGTRHRIQRPQTEPQQSFYSGHTRCHNFSTSRQYFYSVGVPWAQQ